MQVFERKSKKHRQSNHFDENVRKLWIGRGAKECQSDRSHRGLSNEYLIAEIGVDDLILDTPENGIAFSQILTEFDEHATELLQM